MTTENSPSDGQGQRGALRRQLVPSDTDRPKGRVTFDGVELWELPEAGRFSRDAAQADPADLVREFRLQPASQLLNELASDRSDGYVGPAARAPGRPPIPGDWTALYLGYVASRCVAIQPFANWLRGRSGQPLLEAAGFKAVPTRQTIDLHFARLEARAAAFEDVARELIRHARAVERRIGLAFFVDSTHFRSSASLRHHCEDPLSCKANGGVRGASLAPATAAQVLEQHFRETEAAEDVDPQQSARTRGPIISLPTERGATPYRTIFIKGHRYITRDLTSGIRAYTNSNRFWLGGYEQRAVDMYTGMPLATSVFPADVNEVDGYPSLYEGLASALGASPRIVSVDRGFATRPFHEYNARRGVAVVAPFRKRRQGERLQDRRTDAFDEHGVPRCQHCGGPGDQLSADLGPTYDRQGDPYIRFRCLLPRTRSCSQTQRLACASDWVQLPLLPRETALYHAVSYLRNSHEGSFNYDRRRYALNGKEGLGRLCRDGIDAHRLRCAAALLLNWFRLCLRHGWLDAVELEVERNRAEPVWRSNLHGGVGVELLDQLLDERAEHELDLPYGSAASRLRVAYANV